MERYLVLVPVLCLVVGCGGEATPTPDLAATQIALERPAFATVTGRIQTDDWPASPDVILASTACEDERSLSRNLMSRRPTPVEWSTSRMDASGEFGFDDLVPGGYCLLVRWRSWRSSQERHEAIPDCLTALSQIRVFVAEGYEMESRAFVSFGMYTSPFEVMAGDHIRIEIGCH